MGMLTTTFVYKDSKGKISTKSIYNISEQGQYLQGVCNSGNGFRTFRKDRIIEMLDNPYKVDFHFKLSEASVTNNDVLFRKHSADEIDVCFTGFKRDCAGLERLTKLADSKGIKIRKSVTIRLNFLCYGYNAGPSKCEKAREQGAIALNESEFSLLLETGELPDS